MKLFLERQLHLVVGATSSHGGVIAVDDIIVQYGDCWDKSSTAEFEDGFGPIWQPGDTGQWIEWQVVRHEVTDSLGPDEDHTTGTKLGKKKKNIYIKIMLKNITEAVTSRSRI